MPHFSFLESCLALIIEGLVLMIKGALFGAGAYLAIRILSPRTASRLREHFEQQALAKG